LHAKHGWPTAAEILTADPRFFKRAEFRGSLARVPVTPARGVTSLLRPTSNVPPPGSREDFE